LLKLAAWVERSVRRIVLHLPTTYPWLSTLAADRRRSRRGSRLTPASRASLGTTPGEVFLLDSLEIPS
jgi:hypothetical protein